MFLGHHDPFGYFDQVIGNGIKLSTPAIRSLENGNRDHPSDCIFQFDNKFQIFMSAKLEGRSNLSKYYQRRDPIPPSVIRWIILNLIDEHSTLFYTEHPYVDELVLVCKATGEKLHFDSHTMELIDHSPRRGYVDAFDALAMQVPEDIVIQRYDQEKGDWASVISLFHPNGWSAEFAIGKSFAEIHEGVVDSKGKHIVPPNMVKRLVKTATSFERVGAISFRDNTNLHRHPDETWPQFAIGETPLFVRFERQTITGFPDEGLFLFTIKTYFLDVDDKDPERRAKIITAFQNASPEIYSREFVAKKKDEVLAWLGVDIPK